MADMDSMRLELVRIYTCPTYTIGKLYIDGVYQNDTLEDSDRGLDDSMSEEEIRRRKVYAQTAIPKLCNGYLPRLIGTKGFEGVLLHCGSKASNSAGCILQGLNTIKGRLTDSQAVFTKLMKQHFIPAKMLEKEITITITTKYKTK